MVRAPFYDKNGLKKGAWSPEEDNKLREYVKSYGHWNWRQLPKFAGLSRCGKSCRLRWMNYLRPNLKRGDYTKEENDMIMKLHQELGNKWSKISKKLPGRTDNEIKNHWHTHLKKLTNHIQKQTQLHHHKIHTERHEMTPSTPTITNDVVDDTSSASNIIDDIPQSNFQNGKEEEEEEGQGVTVNVPSNSCQTLFEDIVFGIDDFWTQPFIPENVYCQEYHDLSIFNISLFSTI